MAVYIKNVFLPILLMLLTLVTAVPSSGSDNTSLDFVVQPTISQNPNLRVPLAAIIRFTASKPVTTVIQLNDGGREWTLSFEASHNPEKGLAILGMRPNREHTLKISISDDAGNTRTALQSLVYETPPLPTDSMAWPPIAVNVSKPEKMEPGVTILSVRRRAPERANLRTRAQASFGKNFGLIIGLDNEGEVVWYYDAGARVSGIDRLHNGNIIFHNHDYRTVEIDMLGNTVGEYYAEKRPFPKPENPDAIPIIGAQTLHHQPHETVNGTFLSFSANQRTIENWYASEYDPKPRKTQKIMGDTIVEFDKQGNIVWSWNAFDYLDIWRIGYETFDPYWTTRSFPDTWDWTHGNGISYDEEDDSVIASFKLQDAIIKIDKKTKEIKWVFGDPTGWAEKYRDKLLKPLGDLRWPYHMHNPRWTHKRTLLVFNNNKAQAMPFDGREIRPYEETLSNVMEYQIDEEHLTVSEVWVSEKEITESSCVSPAMSEAHRLPVTDNILEINAMCAQAGRKGLTWNPWDMSKRHQAELPRGGKVREYTRTTPAELVYELRFRDPNEIIQWEVYGGFRTPSLY